MSQPQTLDSLKSANTRQAPAVNTERPQNMADFGALLAKNMKQIGSVVASTVTPEKMARIALNELRTNAYLMKMAVQSPTSFVNAVMQASHLGLEIGGALGQAYLVPFKGEIKMMPGYRGLLSLARRSGQITSINAELVYENDTFDLELGIEVKVRHKPYLKGARGNPVLGYMVAHFTDGGHHFEWMTIEDIEAVRKRSSAVQSGKKTPWDTDYEAMCKKTVIRRGWKYLPMSIEMQNAEKIEAANDNNQGLVIDGDSVMVTEPEEQPMGEPAPQPVSRRENPPARRVQQEQVKSDPAEAVSSETGNMFPPEDAYEQANTGPSAADIAAFEEQERNRLAQEAGQQATARPARTRGGNFSVD